MLKNYKSTIGRRKCMGRILSEIVKNLKVLNRLYARRKFKNRLIINKMTNQTLRRLVVISNTDVNSYKDEELIILHK